eukprot:2743022-Amphidinium_carterae.1
MSSSCWCADKARSRLNCFKLKSHSSMTMPQISGQKANTQTTNGCGEPHGSAILAVIAASS